MSEKDLSPHNLCDGTGWVCENHPNLAWGGMSDGTFTCDCGAGAVCQGCLSCKAAAHQYQPRYIAQEPNQ